MLFLEHLDFRFVLLSGLLQKLLKFEVLFLDLGELFLELFSMTVLLLILFFQLLL